MSKIFESNYLSRLFYILDNDFSFITKNPYIIGLGCGKKIINGNVINVPTLTFVVKEKMPNIYIYSKYRIPKYINGILTDVIEGSNNNISYDGKINTYGRKLGKEKFMPYNKHEPAYAGLSVANCSFERKKYGTLTYAITENLTRKNIYLLGPKTALYNPDSNDIRIMSPSIEFGGVNPKDEKDKGSVRGKLSDTTELKFATEGEINPHMNEMNAAIANVGINNGETRTDLLAPYFKVGAYEERVSVNLANSIIAQSAMDQVFLIGNGVWFITANTVTRNYGTIRLLNYQTSLRINEKKYFFKDTIKIDKLKYKIMSGDEGALVMLDYYGLGLKRENNHSTALGMLLGSDSEMSAVLSPIHKVLDKFGMSLLHPVEN